MSHQIHTAPIPSPQHRTAKLGSRPGKPCSGCLSSTPWRWTEMSRCSRNSTSKLGQAMARIAPGSWRIPKPTARYPPAWWETPSQRQSGGEQLGAGMPKLDRWSTLFVPWPLKMAKRLVRLRLSPGLAFLSFPSPAALAARTNSSRTEEEFGWNCLPLECMVN